MLIPVIQFSSMFVKTPKIAEFYSNHELHAECIRFIMLDKEAEPPSFYDVFYFINQFNYGVTVQDIFQMNNPVEKNIDLKYKHIFHTCRTKINVDVGRPILNSFIVLFIFKGNSSCIV